MDVELSPPASGRIVTVLTSSSLELVGKVAPRTRVSSVCTPAPEKRNNVLVHLQREKGEWTIMDYMNAKNLMKFVSKPSYVTT